MTDEKKYTLEGDLREAASWLSMHGKKHTDLRDRLYKWADGKDPNEPDVDLRGIKVGDEVTFEGGGVKEVRYVGHDDYDGLVCFGFEKPSFRILYTYDGTPKSNRRPRIISYRTPPFDFQRSYDRGVRRFVQRDGEVAEVHWFKNGDSTRPVRDGSGMAWTDRGICTGSRTRDLIAEAPAEVQQEGRGDDQ